MFTRKDLQRFQAEPLEDKRQRSLAKISEWFCYWKDAVYVAFSGGLDSTVLADLCALWCSLAKCTLYLVFADTGLEYPEIRNHVKEFAEYLRKKYDIEVVLDIVRPKMRFDEVIKTHGYPLISKEVSNTIRLARANIQEGKYSHRLCKLGVKAEDYGLYDSGKYDYAKALENSKFKLPKWKPLIDLDCDISEECCTIMKKEPMREYEEQTGRMPLIATRAEESMNRENAWFKNGCNAFDSDSPKSTPMAFWLKQDVLWYIKEEKLPICSVYGDIIYEAEPDQLRIDDDVWYCKNRETLCTTGADRTGCMFCAFGCHKEGKDGKPNRFQRDKITHPKQYQYCIGGGEYNEDGKWQPNKQGLGMGHIFDELNETYGEDFIDYK